MRPKRRTAALLLVAFVLASAGLEVALAASPSWRLRDVALLWAIAALLTPLFLLPARLAPPARRAGVGLGLLALLHVAVAVRFGPLLNASALDPRLLVAWALAAVGCVGLGALLSERLARLPLAIPLLVAVLGPVVALLRAGAPVAAAGADGPNVLLVTLDTVRRDHLAPYGHERVRTPTLDRLAAEGTLFEDAVAAAPQTGPSHLTLLSGLDPLAHGVVANGTELPETPWLPSVLRDAGRHTAAFVAAFPVHSRFGFDRGFDVFDDDFGALPGLHALAAVRAVDAVVLRNLPRERTGTRVNAAVSRWLAQDPPEPWFAWVHYYDAHGPYTPPPDLEGLYLEGPPATGGEPLDLPRYWPAAHREITDAAWLEARYQAEITYVDRLLGELLATVEASAGRELLVVVTADHGESMTEHGILFDHGDDLYDPALRVPLVMRGPGVPAGSRVPCQVPAADVAPTVAALLDLPFESGGASRVAELEGPCTDRPAYAATVAARRKDPPVDHAVRWPAAKYWKRAEGEDRLFDLHRDPGETDSVLDARPDLATELRAALEARLEAGTGTREAAGDAATSALLEALGYVEGE